VNLANICSKLGDNNAAALHYANAAELDEDPVRKAVNRAVGYLVEQKFEEADSTLARVPESETQ
jgi:Flp pilus assembly protein TadD